MSALDAAAEAPAQIDVSGLAGLAHRAAQALAFVATALILLIMALIVADIAATKFFAAPITGIDQMVAFAICAASYLQLPNAVTGLRLIRSDAYIGALERGAPRAAAALEAVFYVVGAVLFALMATGTWSMLREAFPHEVFGVEGRFTLPAWPLRALVLAGLVLGLLCMLLLAAQKAAAALRGAGALRLRPLAWVLLGVAMQAGLVAWNPDGWIVGACSVGVVIVWVLLGLHIGPALMLSGLLGIWLMRDNWPLAMGTMRDTVNEFPREYLFGMVPLFVLMGNLVGDSGLGKDAFEVGRWLTRRIRGGLGVATVAANAIFAAICGSSVASATVFTKIATPQMLDVGYAPRFAVGVVAGSSMLGMLIPPSLLFIIYGFLAEASIGQMFVAGIVPGLVLALAFSVAIVLMTRFWPAYAGRPTAPRADDENLGSALRKLGPILGLVAFVFGGMYGGFFGPVEAGAAGAAGAMVIALSRPGFTWRHFLRTAFDTGRLTASLTFLIVGAVVFSKMITISGLAQAMGDFVTASGLGLTGLMLVYLGVVLVLGCFLETLSIMLILVPIVLPTVVALGGDKVWFGIVTTIALEIGLLTPPLGMACFVIKSTLKDDRISLQDVFMGALPFVLIMLAVTVLLIAFPPLVTAVL